MVSSLANTTGQIMSPLLKRRPRFFFSPLLKMVSITGTDCQIKIRPNGTKIVSPVLRMMVNQPLKEREGKYKRRSGVLKFSCGGKEANIKTVNPQDADGHSISLGCRGLSGAAVASPGHSGLGYSHVSVVAKITFAVTNWRKLPKVWQEFARARRTVFFLRMFTYHYNRVQAHR